MRCFDSFDDKLEVMQQRINNFFEFVISAFHRWVAFPWICVINYQVSGMTDKKPLLTVPNGIPQFHPIHLPPPTPTLLRPESEHSEEELQEIRFRRRAQKWPCGRMTFFLGICHLFSGLTLLAFDVFTNEISQTPIAVSASLLFIICAIFSFIAAR